MLTHIGTDTIETERLILRKFKISDDEAMLKYWIADEKIQSPRRETYYPCESLISRAFNGDYSAFYHNYFIFSKI